jgi:nicotinamidase/pyrazinamidase
MQIPEDLGPQDALLIVDVQNDFCAGGRLAVDGAEEIIEPLNRFIVAARENGALIYASRDFHPSGHVSFEERGGMWPPHCLQDTPGAEFHPDLALPVDAIKVTKGVRLDHDQNSAFDATGLASDLRDRDVKRLWVGGLAQDVCVEATVLDARKQRFEVHLLVPATRPVDPARAVTSLQVMQEVGAVLEEE